MDDDRPFNTPSQGSVATPVPIARSSAVPTSQTLSLREKLKSIFASRGIQLQPDVAEVLARDFASGAVDDAQLDAFYRGIVQAGVKEVYAHHLSIFLHHEARTSPANIRILNCFKDVQREIWDPQHQVGHTQATQRPKLLSLK